MSDAARQKWNARYAVAESALPSPPRVLTENAHLAPTSGAALDVACGLGGSALFLARRGLAVEAWDIAEVAIERLRDIARREELEIAARAVDLTACNWPVEAFDLIVVSRFLERGLTGAISGALRPGGLLFYQTFSGRQVNGLGPANPAFRLRGGELLHLFEALQPLVYREEGEVGDLASGVRGEALLVGVKPP